MQLQKRRLNPWELGAAAVLFLLGAFIVWRGFGFPIGTLNRIGPGFFPIVIGILLMLLSAGIMVTMRFQDIRAPDIPFRPLTAIALGLIAFAVLVERAGLVPATFALILVSAFGDRTMGVLRAFAVATAVSALGYAVFILGFRLPIAPFWW